MIMGDCILYFLNTDSSTVTHHSNYISPVTHLPQVISSIWTIELKRKEHKQLPEIPPTPEKRTEEHKIIKLQELVKFSPRYESINEELSYSKLFNLVPIRINKPEPEVIIPKIINRRPRKVHF